MDRQLREWDDDEQAAGAQAANAWHEFFAAQGPPATERAEDVEATAPIVEAKQKNEDRLLRFDNVVGVATSLKVTGGQPTGTWALTILVEKKLPLDEVPEASRVPGELDGVPTDVLEVGRPEALTFNTRVRPALPGFSIGHHNITAGTFGCLVRDIRPQSSGEYLILSNNHVLAAVNAGSAGDLILQPGPFDGGVFPADAVATLERFEPITFGMTGYNVVDCAVAKPLYSRNVVNAIIGRAMPRGIDQALVGQRVLKVGRTTQVTVGRVLMTDATVAVAYGAPGTAVFRHQIITTAMSAGGDSGSLLMTTPDLDAVGLLFAGSEHITIFNHISEVEVALGVRPVTSARFA
jgi:hypothetical protein